MSWQTEYDLKQKLIKSAGKLEASLYCEANKEKVHDTSTYKISLAGNPNSCALKIGNQTYRGLVDSGASLSLLGLNVYKSLKQKPKITNHFVNLQSVNGESLEVKGRVNLDFELNGTKLNHDFYLVKNMNRNLILGHDFVTKNGVRLYFDLACLRVNNTFVPLIEDIHIASIVRSQASVTLKPNTSYIIKGKIKSNPQIPTSRLYQVLSADKGFISEEPGLSISDGLIKLNRSRIIPVQINNTTGRTYRLKRGCVIGKLEQIAEENLVTFESYSKKQENYQKQTSYSNSEISEELNCPTEYRNQILNLISRNRDLLAKKDSDLTQTNTVEMKIPTGTHPPIQQRPYRTPLNSRKIIDQAVSDMLETGIIERSRSSWAFPVVIVEKKDGSSRFCVDYRKLNKITKPIAQPIPLIDDIINRLSGAKYFTSLDLKSGYWQVKMADIDKDKTAFTCHKGLFNFKVMPFGLSQAPAIFTELMNVVLSGLEDFATSYLDDVLIWSSSLEDHMTHIQQVLDRFRQHNLRLKLKKCSFLQTETVHLGFVISKDGVKPDLRKVEAIRNMPSPTCVREVRAFMGSIGYYRRFLPNFSEIAEPLIALTRKNARFRWSDNAQKAFDFLKESLTVIPLLAYPILGLEYKLYTDASGHCVGAVLTQDCVDENNETVERPIYFLSHKLSPTQCRYSTVERECFAIKYALDRLNTYLHGAKFTIFTDHKPLKYLLESPMQNKRVQQWALSIAGYNCYIQYIAGKDNTIADLLSRLPDNNENIHHESISEESMLDISDKSYEVNAINSNEFNPSKFVSCNFKENDHLEKPDSLGYDMIAEQARDPELSQLKAQIEQGQANRCLQRKHIILEGILYYLSNPDENPIIRLYVPNHLTERVIRQFHEIIHLGVDKTFDAIRDKYYWPNLYKQVYDHVSKCVPCQTRNLKKVKAPLTEVDTPPYPFAKIALDLVGPLPKTLSNNVYILTAIDWFSGFVEAWPLPDKKADGIAHLLLDEIFPRYGCPLQVVTDNGSEFVNGTLRKVFEGLNIQHVRTTPYSPWSNGKCERSHRALIDVISKKMQDNNHTWDLYLNQALAAIRFSISETTKFSPFFLLFQRDPVFPIDNLLKPRRRYYGDDIIEKGLEQTHKAFVMVHKRQKQARRKQAKYANKNSKDVEFKIGDPVYFKNHIRVKVGQKWKPYYRIIEKKTPVTFTLKDQLTGETVPAHAQHIGHADIDEWEIPKNQANKRFRRANFVIPPSESESEKDSASSGSETESQSQRLVQKYKQVRSDSEDEMKIPLAELARRLKHDKSSTDNTQSNLSDSSSDDEAVSRSIDHEQSMDIGHIRALGTRRKKLRKTASSDKSKLKNLLKVISDVL